ncbi:MAG: hypothetical protein ACRD24_00075, partial [Terriglobales bacterium]
IFFVPIFLSAWHWSHAFENRCKNLKRDWGLLELFASYATCRPAWMATSTSAEPIHLSDFFIADLSSQG